MLDNLFKSKYHSALKWLNGKKWLDIRLDDKHGAMCHLKPLAISREEMLEVGQELVERASWVVREYSSLGSSFAMYAKTISEMIASGPKLFRPTAEQCLALENTEIKIPFETYQQPFPVVMIQIPPAYREHLKIQYKTNRIPSLVITSKLEHNIISSTSWFGIDDNVVITMSPKYNTIEEALVASRSNKHNDQFDFMREALGDDVVDHMHNVVSQEVEKNSGGDLDFVLAEVTQRLGINFSLMMTLLGVKESGPASNEARYYKNVRVLENPHANETNKQRAKESVEKTTMLYEFDQQIEFYETNDQRTKHGVIDDGRNSPKPHWRRGHFRMQAHGENHSLRKLIFIKPIMVMKDIFIGDLADTTTTYTAKGKSK